MIDYVSARHLLREVAAARSLGTERVPLATAVGRVTARAVCATLDHPRFVSSSMDGFAIRSADAPGVLRVGERIAAGRAEPAPPLGVGECHAIMTGGKLPEGADAVVPVERVDRLPEDRIRVEGVAAGDFVRRAGADFHASDVVVPAGTTLRPDHLLALATLGIGELEVVRAPRVGLVTTGAEVVGELGAPLGPSQIHDATGPFLVARLREHGAVVSEHHRVGDAPDAFEAWVSRAASDADLLISTGAVSMGDHDFVPEVLRGLGAEVLFHRVAIRPGKPILLARLPGGAPFLGLPGNPASSAVGFRFFVRPLLDAMRGTAPETSTPAALTRAHRKGDVRLQCFLRARLGTSDHGVRQVEILPDQPSYKVRPFVEGDGWAVLGQDVTELPAGAIVETFPA